MPPTSTTQNTMAPHTPLSPTSAPYEAYSEPLEVQTPAEAQCTSQDPQQGPRSPALYPNAPAQLPRRSTRVTLGKTDKYADSYIGKEYDEVTNCIDPSVFGITALENQYQPQPQIPLLVGEIVGSDKYLMALPLPMNHWDKSAWWTGEGWVWIQH